MRDRIRERLTEYRAEALQSIGDAVNRTKSKFSGAGRMNSGYYYRTINKDNEDGFAKYMDRSANFIRHVAASSWSEYADELRAGGDKLKQEIMAKIDHENYLTSALGENSTRVQLRNELDSALVQLIKRKVEDFELDYQEGKDMSPTIHNEVNITNSNIENAVVQITQSGKDSISKETALKLREIINSEEIKGLPESDRLEVLEQADVVLKELNAPATNDGKVVRGLRTLGRIASSVAAKVTANIIAQLLIAYATAKGIMPPT